MRYLVDTDVIIDHLRRKQPIQEQILQEGAISIISLGELIYGAYKSANLKKSLATLKKDLQILDFKMINIDEPIIAKFGQIKARLEQQGIRLDDFDLLIASTAQVLNLTLVTRNTRHFKRIKGLRLTD